MLKPPTTIPTTFFNYYLFFFGLSDFKGIATIHVSANRLHMWTVGSPQELMPNKVCLFAEHWLDASIGLLHFRLGPRTQAEVQ